MAPAENHKDCQQAVSSQVMEDGVRTNKPTAAIVGVLCFIAIGAFIGAGEDAYAVVFLVVGVVVIIGVLKTDPNPELSWKSALIESVKLGPIRDYWVVVVILIWGFYLMM